MNQKYSYPKAGDKYNIVSSDAGGTIEVFSVYDGYVDFVMHEGGKPNTMRYTLQEFLVLVQSITAD